MKLYEYLMDLAERSGLHHNQEILEAIKMASLTRDEDLIQAIESQLKLAFLEKGSPLPIPLPQEIDGPVKIGIEPYSRAEVGFDFDTPLHMLIVGETGTGKTTLIRNILDRLQASDIKFWIFDVKEDFKLIPQEWDVYSLHLRDLKLNPLEGPIDAKDQNWLEIFWEVLCQTEDLLSGSLSFGYKILYDLFQSNEMPSMFDLEEAIIKEWSSLPKSSPSFQYADRIRARIEALNRQLKDTFYCSRGYPVQELVKHNIAFLYSGMSTIAAKFLILILLYKNFYWRMASNQRGSKTHQVIVIDEAQQILPHQDYRQLKSTPFFDLLLARAREFGICFIIASQSGRVPLAIRENSRIKVSFNLGSGSDVTNIARDLALKEPKLLQQLQVGEAIVKKNIGYNKPFMLKTYEFEFEPKAGSKDILQALDRYVRAPVRIPKQEENDRLDIEQEDLLRHINANPLLTTTERIQALKQEWVKIGRAIYPQKMLSLVKYLENKGFIRSITLKIGAGQGKSAKFLELTEKGKAYLKRLGIKPLAYEGSFEHFYWVERLKLRFEIEGYEVKQWEAIDKGVKPDLLLLLPEGKRIAIEVELSDNGLRNIKKLIGKVDGIVMAFTDNKLLKNIKREAKKALTEEQNIMFISIYDLELDPHQALNVILI